jgi:ferredoxin
MIDKIKQRVKELLEAKTVGVFIGYEKGDNPNVAKPVYITAPEEINRLIWPSGNEIHTPILCKYLLKPELKQFGQRGIIASPSDVRGITGLIQEKQITRTDIYVIAVSNPSERAIGRADGEKMPQTYDEVLESPKSETRIKRSEEIGKKIKELESLSAADRLAFWKKEFSKCIKCYACRQICPLCYCRVCIADKNQPQWVLPLPNSAGNFAWNTIRAYHLAGRCIECGECERACPVNIPLMLLNNKMTQIIKDNFDVETGVNPEATPPLATYNPEDKENFII